MYVFHACNAGASMHYVAVRIANSNNNNILLRFCATFYATFTPLAKRLLCHKVLRLIFLLLSLSTYLPLTGVLFCVLLLQSKPQIVVKSRKEIIKNCNIHTYESGRIVKGKCEMWANGRKYG